MKLSEDLSKHQELIKLEHIRHVRSLIDKFGRWIKQALLLEKELAVYKQVALEACREIAASNPYVTEADKDLSAKMTLMKLNLKVREPELRKQALIEQQEARAEEEEADDEQ